MKLGLALSEEYRERFVERLLAWGSLPCAVIRWEEKEEPVDLLVTDRPEVRAPAGTRLVRLVERAPRAPNEVDRRRRASTVIADVLARLSAPGRKASFLPWFCLVCPGDPASATVCGFLLASALAEPLDRVALLDLREEDPNDALLDSPCDDGFSRLFLATEETDLLSRFSFEHALRFYYLASPRTPSVKRELGRARWEGVLTRMAARDLFDALVFVLDERMDETGAWLLERAAASFWAAGPGPYARLCAHRQRSRRGASPWRDVVLCARPEGRKPTEGETIVEWPPDNPFVEGLAGWRLSERFRTAVRLEPLVQICLERMMCYGRCEPDPQRDP